MSGIMHFLFAAVALVAVHGTRMAQGERADCELSFQENEDKHADFELEPEAHSIGLEQEQVQEPSLVQVQEHESSEGDSFQKPIWYDSKGEVVEPERKGLVTIAKSCSGRIKCKNTAQNIDKYTFMSQTTILVSKKFTSIELSNEKTVPWCNYDSKAACHEHEVATWLENSANKGEETVGGIKIGDLVTVTEGSTDDVGVVATWVYNPDPEDYTKMRGDKSPFQAKVNFIGDVDHTSLYKHYRASKLNKVTDKCFNAVRFAVSRNWKARVSSALPGGDSETCKCPDGYYVSCKDPEEEHKAKFKHFDGGVSKSSMKGGLNKEEIKKALKALGRKHNEAEIDEELKKSALKQGMSPMIDLAAFLRLSKPVYSTSMKMPVVEADKVRTFDASKIKAATDQCFEPSVINGFDAYQCTCNKPKPTVKKGPVDRFPL